MTYIVLGLLDHIPPGFTVNTEPTTDVVDELLASPRNLVVSVVVVLLVIDEIRLAEQLLLRILELPDHGGVGCGGRRIESEGMPRWEGGAVCIEYERGWQWRCDGDGRWR